MNGGDFADLLRGLSIFLDVEVDGKAALIDALAARAAPIAGVAAEVIAAHVHAREALGSTGFGQGAATPHGRIPGLEAVTLVVMRLARPIDYGALDDEPVDVAVLLLSPEEAGANHLKALARVSRALRNPQILSAMRAAETADELFEAIDRPALRATRAA